MQLKLKIRVSEFLLIALVLGVVCYALLYAQDPIGPKLEVAGEIELGAGKSLRLQPVAGTAPASPEIGDLYFNGTALFTYDGAAWQTVSEKGDIFYNDNDSSLYFHNGTTWQKIGAGGGGVGGTKTIASRIVAAVNSLNTTCVGANCTNPRADYICNGTQTTGGDEVTINAAITELGATGGAVYLLEGNYWITDKISINYSNVSIIGAGAGTIISPKNSATLNANGVITNILGNNILLTNFKIDGNKANNNINDQYGIYFLGTKNSKIDKVWVENMKKYGIYFFWSSSTSTYNIISDSSIKSNDGYGNICLYRTNDNIISGNNIQSSTFWDGIYFYSTSNNIIYNNNIQANDNQGINLIGNNNIILGNNIQSNASGGSAGIEITGGNNTIFGNNMQSNKRGISLYTASCNLISNNNIQSNTYEGIYLDGSSNNTISGNIIYDNGGTGNYPGIYIYSNSDNNILSSNLLYDSAGTGRPINIAASTCDNNYLIGNLISGWPAGYENITDSGTNTTYTDKNKMTLEKLQVNITTASYNLDATSTPRSYCALNPSVAVSLTLTNGKSGGDLLILENNSTNSVTINDSGNINLEGNKVLGRYDTLELIWNGARWLQLDWKDN